jgi:hypothetical protein
MDRRHSTVHSFALIGGTLNINIEKLPTPENQGDHHDKPFKYVVVGPGNERQKFSTKKAAQTYMRVRKQQPFMVNAISVYARGERHAY